MNRPPSPAPRQRRSHELHMDPPRTQWQPERPTILLGSGRDREDIITETAAALQAVGYLFEHNGRIVRLERNRWGEQHMRGMRRGHMLEELSMCAVFERDSAPVRVPAWLITAMYRRGKGPQSGLPHLPGVWKIRPYERPSRPVDELTAAYFKFCEAETSAADMKRIHEALRQWDMRGAR